MRLSAEERKAHAISSEMYLISALYREAAYHAAVAAAIREYGDGNGRDISGAYRGHFPVEVKNTLRALILDYQYMTDTSLEHWILAGRRVHTWRKMKDKMGRVRIH